MGKGSAAFNLITILGHTAGGKTRFAACLADRLGGEVISADSRQVYRRMNLGTGKDYMDYQVDGRPVAHHLIDVLEPGYEYNVFEYQRDFLRVYRDVRERGNMAVLCGGSGLYIEAVLKGYRLMRVPANKTLRKELREKSMEELCAMLASFKNLHNKTDTENRKRLLRALEIEHFYRDRPQPEDDYPDLRPLILGIRFDRESRRERISQRLMARLKEGMVEEVEALLADIFPWVFGPKSIMHALIDLADREPTSHEVYNLLIIAHRLDKTGVIKQSYDTFSRYGPMPEPNPNMLRK